MAEKGKTLARFEPGMEAIPAEDLNAIGRAGDAFLGSDFGEGFRDGNGLFTARARRSASPGSTIQRLIITAVNDDYLTCRTYDGTTTGSVDILVAKPPSLRSTITSYTAGGETWACTYDTDAATRTATGGTTGIVETQKLNVPYATAGDNTQIWAATVTGNTGVTVSGTELMLIDLNVDARHWVRQQI